MFDFGVNAFTTDDIASLGAVLFLMIAARFLKDESRIASYGLIAVFLTGNWAVLYAVPLLYMVVKLMRFV